MSYLYNSYERPLLLLIFDVCWKMDLLWASYPGLFREEVSKAIAKNWNRGNHALNVFRGRSNSLNQEATALFLSFLRRYNATRFCILFGTFKTFQHQGGVQILMQSPERPRWNELEWFKKLSNWAQTIYPSSFLYHQFSPQNFYTMTLFVPEYKKSGKCLHFLL